jgi:hypothetical protein
MKKWYLSKTLWANIIAVVAIVVGEYNLTPDTQVAILGVVNLLLRLVTKEKIIW